MVYFKYETKLFMLQMLITFAIRLHWVCYWLIYTEKIRCLSSLVDIYVCLFNQKWLGIYIALPSIEMLLFVVLDT